MQTMTLTRYRYFLSYLFLFFFSIKGISQNQPVLVKDINTPQSGELRAAVVYALGNKILYSDGTALGSKVAYTGAADATVTAAAPYVPAFRGPVFFFLEKNANSAKILRYNSVTTEVVKTVNNANNISFFMPTLFVPNSTLTGEILFVLNGNELWIARSKGEPTLIKTFDSPIRDIKPNTVLTANSVWSLNIALGTVTLLKDGLSKTGELASFGLFAADDGGFNGTELWIVNAPTNAYLFKDINPGTASSNPRDFFYNINRSIAVFTGDSAGKKHLFRFISNTSVQSLVSTESNIELKAMGVNFGYDASSNFEEYVTYISNVGSSPTYNIIVANKPNQVPREVIRFREGAITHATPDGQLFTHTKANGISDIWRFDYANNSANLLIANASTKNIIDDGVYFLASDDGKLWQINRNTAETELIRDFGAGTKVIINGKVNGFEGNGYVTLLLITAINANGTTTTWQLELDYNSQKRLRDVTTVSLEGSGFSSYPSDFYEVNGTVLFNAIEGKKF